MYIMYSCLLSHKHEQLLLKPHFLNPSFSRSKRPLNQMCSNGLQKYFSSIKVLLLFQSSMLKSSPIFKRTGAHLVKKVISKKTRIVHFRGLNAFNMQKHFSFVSNFEHVKFLINGKYSQSNYNNSNYYASLMIFKHTQMQF